MSTIELKAEDLVSLGTTKGEPSSKFFDSFVDVFDTYIVRQGKSGSRASRP